MSDEDRQKEWEALADEWARVNAQALLLWARLKKLEHEMQQQRGRSDG